jgi:hypothetical protein
MNSFHINELDYNIKKGAEKVLGVPNLHFPPCACLKLNEQQFRRYGQIWGQ